MELFMNTMESAVVMERLRQGIITYINHTISLLSIREQPFLPVPFPADPTRLPTDFPDGDCVHTFTVQWNDLEHQVQHKFEVKLRHFRPEPDEQHIIWELVFKRRHSYEARTRIGLLLLDRVVYEDQNFYQISGPGVLFSLGLSVLQTRPVHIRKITLASTNVPHTSLEVVRMYSNGSPIIELARREV